MTLAGLRESIHKGRTLSEAMEEMKGVFPNLLVYMTRTGESSGRLDELLHKMAGYYGREEELNGKVRAAMTYPVILFSITVLAAVFMPVSYTHLDRLGGQWCVRRTGGCRPQGGRHTGFHYG